MSADTRPGRVKPGPSRQMLRRSLFLCKLSFVFGFLFFIRKAFLFAIFFQNGYEQTTQMTEIEGSDMDTGGNFRMDW